MQIDPATYYPLEEVAEHFGVSNETIRRWITETKTLRGFRGSPLSPHKVKGQWILDFENGVPIDKQGKSA